ncbi:uncharacterized protein LOC124497550 [Dermatophagoides farinae]|uniref:uncharacterized protein LOC124497550 n=1 Tax=Dermatophagoides farinae TaxID=6954 RepID=UPI003F6215BE
MIKIFAVRLFYNFYRMIGFSFGRFEWKHRWTMIKCTIMTTLFINGSYHVYIHNSQEYDGVSATKISQNAFGRLIDMIGEFLYLITFIVSYLVYSLNGYDLIRLADSSIFTIIYPDNLKHRFIAITFLIITIIDCSLLFNYFASLTTSSMASISMMNLLKCYIMVMMYLSEILLRSLFYYFKNAIRQSLQRIELQLKSNEITDEECISTIRLLAYISLKFNSKAGFFGFLFILEWTFYLIHTLLTIHQGQATVFSMIILAINSSFTFLWIWMDNRIQRTLRNIIKHLRYRNDRRQQNFKIQSARSMDHLLALLDLQRQNSMDTGQLWPLFDQIGAIWMMKIRPKSRNQIRYFEMIHLYQEYFRMKFYDLFIYDQRFLLSMIIAAYGYFVLLIQTENNEEKNQNMTN